jgi:hypothetical protein
MTMMMMMMITMVMKIIMVIVCDYAESVNSLMKSRPPFVCETYFSRLQERTRIDGEV